MKNPLVSVIVPNYNYARYLAERLDSVLGQTFRDFEVIILDDCSTDDSRDVIGRYAGHPQVSRVVFNETNSGNPFVQWEKGLGLAKGKYVWIAEADDCAEPTFLERTVAVMESDDSIAVVKTMSRLIDSEGQPSPHKPFEDFEPDGDAYIYDGSEYLQEKMIWWNHCYNASMVLMRRDAWCQIQDKSYVRLRYVGDWLFWGMLMNGRRVAEIHKPLSRFRLHGNSVTDGARQTPRLRAEGEIVAYMFRNMLPGLPFGLKVYNRYNLYRIFHRGGLAGFRRELESIDPKFWDNIGITSASYPLFWLYKHTIWLVEKRFVSSRQAALRPVNIIHGVDFTK